MLYIAFTLGFFGSLHCLGMCGPLALAFSNRPGQSKRQNFFSGLAYNFGRITTYGFIGILFGLIGSFIFFADFQKYLSIGMGVLLVLSFLFSINIDHKIQRMPFFAEKYQQVHALLSGMMKKSQDVGSFLLGMANGLLPCGLVYLALAGSLATGNIYSGFSFMVFFGLGTIPMLLTLTTGSQLVSGSWRSQYKKIIPWVSLAFGVFLIYRGVAVEIPTELNFWEALKNPIMCH